LDHYQGQIPKEIVEAMRTIELSRPKLLECDVLLAARLPLSVAEFGHIGQAFPDSICHEKDGWLILSEI
jgi:hypothetical protein